MKFIIYNYICVACCMLQECVYQIFSFASREWSRLGKIIFFWIIRKANGWTFFVRFSLMNRYEHKNDFIMGAMAFLIASLAIVYSTVYSCVDQRKHQSSASLAFVREINRWQVNSPYKGPVLRKMFPFDDAIMISIDLYKCHDIFRHWNGGWT